MKRRIKKVTRSRHRNGGHPAVPRSTLSSRLLFSVAVVALPLAISGQPGAGIYTAAQAESGRALYARTCSGCHGADFAGSGDAPALTGGTFMLKWRPKMVSELFGEILQNMPPANPGSLGEAAALNATAYILQRNGAPAGPQALAPGTATLIGSIATGQTQVQGRGGRGASSIVVGSGSAGPGRAGVPVPHGVTAAGEVQNYVPVTPEMLK